MNEKSSGSRSRKQRLTAVGTRCADHVTPLYPQKLAVTSPTGGGRSVGIVRVRTKATEFSLMRYTNTVTPQIFSSNESFKRSSSQHFMAIDSLTLCSPTFIRRTSGHCERTFRSIKFTVGYPVCLSVFGLSVYLSLASLLLRRFIQSLPLFFMLQIVNTRLFIHRKGNYINMVTAEAFQHVATPAPNLRRHLHKISD